MKLFALRHVETGRLMFFDVDSNGDDAEFCGSTRTSLSLPYRDDADGNVWVTTSRAVADKAAETNTPWYNADLSSPENEYVGLLEVAELFA